jgi:hypothetical protein
MLTKLESGRGKFIKQNWVIKMTFNRIYGSNYKSNNSNKSKYSFGKNSGSKGSSSRENDGGENSGFLGGGSHGFKSDRDGGENSGFLGGGSHGFKSDRDGGENSGFLGGGSHRFKFGRNGEENSGFLGASGQNNANGFPPANNRLIMGTDCNDTLYGGHCGKDTLVGTTEVGRGMGEHDTLIGGRAQDTFVLGDTHGSYYLGGGNSDYATIQQFDLKKDIIQLTGSAQDYSIFYSQGVASLYHHSSAGCDLVAQIDSPCTGLDLNANYFNYVTPACGNM